MPALIQGSFNSKKFAKDVRQVTYDYDYPEGMDLKPGSDLHESLKETILERARESYFEMSKRHDEWESINHTLNAYIPAKDLEDKEDRTKTKPIIIPIQYATRETILTYMVATFLDAPYFRYDWVGPEDKVGAMLLERVVDFQARRKKMGLNLHTNWMDGFTYGFGAVAPIWTREYAYKSIIREDNFFSEMFDKLLRVSGSEKREQVETLLYEGGELENIDPLKYLPDPNVPIHDVQKGESTGWIDRTNRLDLSTVESHDDTYFNVKYIKHLISGVTSLTLTEDSGRNKEHGTEDSILPSTNPVDVINMFFKLIPSEWDLGDSDVPEKWLFSLAADEVIIRAQPINLNHGMFPISVNAPDYDGYSITPTGRLEMTYGLQETMDWLFQSHIANVRKAINDMLIVDPSMININDVMSPRPGKVIRTRRRAWGRGVRDGIDQLKVTDVTGSHIADTSYIIDLMKQISATPDNLQGIMRSGGERRSATEARDTRTSALSRLEKSAKIIGMQSMQDLAYMLASHTQQFMSEDTYVKVAGRLEEDLKKELGMSERVPVRPKDILIEYDVAPYDGTMPGGESADLWTNLYQIMATQPEIAQQFDMVRIFKHIARQLGAKNVNDFVKQGGNVQPKVMDDESVAREEQAGNIVPINEQGA